MPCLDVVCREGYAYHMHVEIFNYWRKRDVYALEGKGNMCSLQPRMIPTVVDFMTVSTGVGNTRRSWDDRSSLGESGSKERLENARSRYQPNETRLSLVKSAYYSY